MTKVRPRRPTRHRHSLSALLLVPAIFSTILCSLPAAQAYIPAQPLNDTSRLNLTDASTIGITWVLPAGVYSGQVSYQLQADIPTGGTTSGALVHFTENTMGPNQSTTTPWIAYISCEVNETDASQEWDIFTLARDRGAVSALLYSPSSQSCLLNTEYITDFEKPLDVFAAETLQVARIINGKFVNTNETFYYYNGTLLNESSNAVNLSLAGTPLQQRTFLIGTLTARNSTGQIQPTGIPGGNDRPSDNDNGNDRSGQPPAMIALYVVTGCISAMFALMIGMAARRAIRHPERYGRREGNENEAAQTRAGGIAQALLDTFPIVKFNRRDAVSKELDSETEMETRQLPHTHADQERGNGTRRLLSDDSHGHGGGDGDGGLRRDSNSDPFRSPRDRARTLSASGVIPMEPGALSYQSALDRHDKGEDQDDDISIKSVERSSSQSKSKSQHQLPRAVSASGSRLDPNMGQTPTSGPVPVSVPGNEIPGDMEEQCPICLLDFEDGDDLRVLPCEKEHVYHQTCIDPWLLDVSSSCPLCRKDFNSVPESPTAATAASSSSSHQAPTQSGFAKYLAFMRREKRTARDDSGPGPNRNRNRSRAGTGISHSSGSGSGSGHT